jgi:predicted transposase/invertase (TIGR01784 family)
LETDNSLKILIASFSEAFAQWLLGQPPERVLPLNVELPATAVRSDLLFQVTLAGGQVVFLHIELQGRRSPDPMPWRMADYMLRVARRELGANSPDEATARLHSAVIYVGPWAGAGDSGRHEILDADGQPSLSWRYQPVRLWEMDAEELLALGQPALLALIGQTRIKDAQQVIPELLTRMEQVEDKRERVRILSLMASLTSNQEVIEMVEKLLDPLDEYLFELPLQQRFYQRGRQEGEQTGRQEGVRQTTLKNLRQILTIRFEAPPPDFERRLEPLDLPALEQLITAALTLPTWAEFEQRVVEERAKTER